jgi:hypothetical protein
MKRPPKRERWQSGGGIVLAQIRDVRQRGRRQRQQECYGGLRTQSLADDFEAEPFTVDELGL